MSNPGPAVTYFWSGSNHAGEILALAKHNKGIGVAVHDLDRGGRAMAALESLGQDRIEISVTQASGGRPILMFHRDRQRQARLPEGDVSVKVRGRPLLLGFRKIAVNVARTERGAPNILGDLLRRIFGPNAGARGEGHRVILVREADGWRMSDARLEELRRSQSPVFVDSGAFSEVEFDPVRRRMVTRSPITDTQWRERLEAYRRIAAALGPRAHLVAPDKVGDQAETLRRLSRFAPDVRHLRALGAQIIVPIQRGTMDGGAFDAECTRILGFSDYIRGIPSKKSAATVAEIRSLSRQLPPDARVHLLGLGTSGDRIATVLAALDRPSDLVSCDSVRIKALVGRTNGPGGGPRALTRLTDMVRRTLGLPASPARLDPATTARVKFLALDRYLTDRVPPP